MGGVAGRRHIAGIEHISMSFTDEGATDSQFYACWPRNVYYHATESPSSIGTRVHLELTITKSRYGS